jgi:hypothetical protein
MILWATTSKVKKRSEARGPSVSPALQLGCGLSGKDGTNSIGKQFD